MRSKFVQHDNDGEFICPDLVQFDPDAQFQSVLKADSPMQQPSSLGRLGSVELVQRAVVAALAIIRCIVAKPRIAQLIPA
ncbi:MAG TPA: hypothetical protein PLZ95_16555 [Bryobacteraceae bacterium]|nr:hypothetical protein [Bryobacteraceae bacterium]